MASLFKASAKLLFALGLAATSMQGALAHTYFSSIYLGDQALDAGDCMRKHPSTAHDSPIATLDAADMTCGWLPEANIKANRKCPVAAGTKVGLQWYHQSPSPADDIVDPTHVGPIMVYMAKSESGSGNVWFKIYEDGYDANTKKWAVDKLIANRGRVDVTIPADIEPGNYLFRGEILALHGANALNGVQPYVGCAELTITGNGKASPAGVAIPGIYKNTDKGMLFDRYQPFSSYPIPGPAVYKSGSAPSNGSPATSAPVYPTPAAPAATTRPTEPAATSAPSVPISSNGNIKVGLNGGTNVWWFGAIVSAGSDTTVKVEMMDSGSNKNWVVMVDQGYAYTYNSKFQIVLPVSLRVTSSSGKQVVLTNVYNSFSSGNSLIDTGKSYSGSSSTSTSAPATSAPKPTSAPATSAPATSAPATSAPATSAPKPTSAPATSAPSTGDAKITLHAGAGEWWFAMYVDADVSKVEIKDSGAYSTFSTMTVNNWGGPVVYSLSTSGAPFVAPFTTKITSKSGKVVTATIASITPNSVVALGSL